MMTAINVTTDIRRVIFKRQCVIAIYNNGSTNLTLKLDLILHQLFKSNIRLDCLWVNYCRDSNTYFLYLSFTRALVSKIAYLANSLKRYSSNQINRRRKILIFKDCKMCL